MLEILETNCTDNSPTVNTLALAAKRRSTYSEGNMGKFWGDERSGREKVAFWRTKAAISLKCVKMEEKLLESIVWTAYRNSPTLFRTIPSPTPYGLPLCGHSQGPPKFWVPLNSGTGKATVF